MLEPEIVHRRAEITDAFFNALGLPPDELVPASSPRFSRLRQVQYVAALVGDSQDFEAKEPADIVADTIATGLWKSIECPAVVSRTGCIELKDTRNLSSAFVPRAHNDILQIQHCPSSVASAFDLLRRWPVWEGLADHLGQLILLDSRGGEEATHSYTLTLTPCVVYADVVRDPGRMAEAIAHETAHCRFNELLSLCDQLPSEPRWWSPWKETTRPAFGLLHAAYAFSHVVLYVRWLTENVQVGANLAYAASRLRTERVLLRSIERSVAEAASLLSHPLVRKELTAKVEEACHG